jgi:hypothetical protein
MPIWPPDASDGSQGCGSVLMAFEGLDTFQGWLVKKMNCIWRSRSRRNIVISQRCQCKDIAPIWVTSRLYCWRDCLEWRRLEQRHDCTFTSFQMIVGRNLAWLRPRPREVQDHVSGSADYLASLRTFPHRHIFISLPPPCNCKCLDPVPAQLFFFSTPSKHPRSFQSTVVSSIPFNKDSQTWESIRQDQRISISLHCCLVYSHFQHDSSGWVSNFWILRAKTHCIIQLLVSTVSLSVLTTAWFLRLWVRVNA